MKSKEKVIITIAEQKGKNAKITCECIPILAFEIIKKIAKDNELKDVSLQMKEGKWI